MEFLVGLFLLILGITTRVSLSNARDRVKSLEDGLEAQKLVSLELERQFKKLKAEGAPSAQPAPAAQPVAPPAAAPTATPPLTPVATPKPAPPPAPRPAPPVAPAPVAPAPAVPPPVAKPAGPPPPRVPPPAPPMPPPPQKPAFDWESLVGVRLFAMGAGLALVIAAVFFLKISIQRGWLAPPARVVLGVIASIALLVLCELKAARKYRATANALDAAAIAILFSTFFAAHALWNLIPTTPTFGLLALVTAVAVLLSIRRESLFIALLGLVGGFMTPILLSTGQNQPIPLFSYLFLLNVGLAWVAYRKSWPVLTVLSAIFTTVYQWGWVVKFLHESSLSLAMGIFLLFPVVAIGGMLLGNRHRPATDPNGGWFERTGLIVSALPLVFAIYLAAVPAYGANATLLFGFLLIIDAGLMAVAIARREAWLHACGGAATLLVVGLYLGISYTPSAWTTVLVALGAVVVLYLVAPWIAEMMVRPFNEVGLQSAYVAPLALFAFTMLAPTERAAASPWVLFALLFALAGLVAWRAMAARQGGLYFVAAFFVLAAEAAWSGVRLTGDTLSTGIALYALFGFYAIGVPVTARRIKRALEPAFGAGIVLIAGLGLLLFLAAGSVAPLAIWGLALLLAILNAALFVESASGRLPALSIVGGVLSWIVLAVWWWRAAAVVGLLPSLLVVIILSLVMLAGHAWAHAQSTAGGAKAGGTGFRSGLFLGLVGHFFLFFVAGNPAWSQPPWPMFGALGALTLAVSVVALFARESALQIGGAVASSAVVLVWTANAPHEPWPFIALAAALAVSLFNVIWIAASSRRGFGDHAAIAAGAALFLGELIAIIVGMREGEPRTLIMMAAHAVNLATILALAWRYEWPWVAPVAVLPAWLAVSNFVVRHPEPGSWLSCFAFAGALYAVFAIYPFVLGRRAQATRDPHIALVLASGFFLMASRTALTRGGLSLYIGAVPVFEAAVLAVLLRQLLRLEVKGGRDLARIALVAGAALAFITVAIPLQLKHQWITIGWALEGAALAWLATRVAHDGLRYVAVALLGAVFARLVLNPGVYYYEPRGGMRVLNWYLYAYAISGAAMLLAARWLGKVPWRWRFVMPPVFYSAGAVTLFWLLNIEIADFYATGPEITFRFGVTLAQDLTYTIGWLVFGLIALSAGIFTHSRATRIASLALIVVTTVKCFLYDMRSLDGLYRVGAFAGLAVSLAVVSVALQKFVLAKPQAEQ